MLMMASGLMTACASKPNVYAQADPTTDFNGYQTYGFYDNPSTNNAEYESLITNFLKVSVAQQLDARGMSYDPWPGYAYETRIDQYTEGTLNTDIADVARQKLVWEGALVGSITEQFVRNLESGLDQAVNEIFSQYPVKPLYRIDD